MPGIFFNQIGTRVTYDPGTKTMDVSGWNFKNIQNLSIGLLVSDKQFMMSLRSIASLSMLLISIPNLMGNVVF